MKSEVKKILLVTLSNLGDVVLTLPVLQSLRSAYPKAEMHVMAGPGAAMAFESDKRIARFIPYKKKTFAEKWQLLQQVRGERYDIIVDLRRSLIGFLGAAGKRNRYLDLPSQKMHRRARHLRALRGIAPVSNEESFLKNAASPVRSLTSAGQAVVVAAVGSKSDIKKWPAEHYARLLDRLASERSCRIILVGDGNDCADAEKVKKFMNSPSEDLTGHTDWTQLVTVIAQASLVVTNDSAPLHIADSLKVPVLALFGPTDPGKYGPRSGRSLSVSRKIFCSPCEKAQCRFNHECLKELSPDEVYAKAIQVLDDRTRKENFRILVIRLDRLGDLALTLPALDALRKQYPDASISLMTRPATKELLEGHPWLDEVIAYDYGKGGRHRFPLGYFRFLKEIIRRRFDVAFVLHPGVRSYLVPFLAHIPYRIGYRNKLSFLLTASAADERHRGTRHESEYALDVLRVFGVPTPPGLEAKLFPPSLSHEGASVTPCIAVHAGSSCPSKRWMPERFEALGSRLLTEFPRHRLVIIGGQEEQELGRRLKEAWGERSADLTGKLSLKELAECLKRSELLISNDSGPVHVAAAVGTRVISLFSRNQAGLSPTRWRPLGKGHAVIQKDVGCVVCLAHKCPIEFECLKAISVDEVFTTAKQMLSKTPILQQ